LGGILDSQPLLDRGALGSVAALQQLAFLAQAGEAGAATVRLSAGHYAQVDKSGTDLGFVQRDYLGGLLGGLAWRWGRCAV
jgi:hypothetical protein